MIGEGKHGLWRIQDNGMIREYRKKKSKGLPKGTDIFDKKNFNKIKEDYGHYLKEEGLKGYKFPQDKLDKMNYLKIHRPTDKPPQIQGEVLESYSNRPSDLVLYNVTS